MCGGTMYCNVAVPSILDDLQPRMVLSAARVLPEYACRRRSIEALIPCY
jgi:hypothetical protein